MKRIPWLVLILIIVAVLANSAKATPVGELRLERAQFASAGGPVSNGDYSLQASFGQAFAGTSSNGEYQLIAGFLVPDEVLPNETRLYLPLISQ